MGETDLYLGRLCRRLTRQWLHHHLGSPPDPPGIPSEPQLRRCAIGADDKPEQTTCQHCLLSPAGL